MSQNSEPPAPLGPIAALQKQQFDRTRRFLGFNIPTFEPAQSNTANPFPALQSSTPDVTSNDVAFNKLVDNVLLGGAFDKQSSVQTPQTSQVSQPTQTQSTQTSIFNAPVGTKASPPISVEHTSEGDNKESIF